MENEKKCGKDCKVECRWVSADKAVCKVKKNYGACEIEGCSDEDEDYDDEGGDEDDCYCTRTCGDDKKSKKRKRKFGDCYENKRYKRRKIVNCCDEGCERCEAMCNTRLGHWKSSYQRLLDRYACRNKIKSYCCCEDGECCCKKCPF